MLYFFEEGYSPENIGGQRLLVDKNNKKAYQSNQRIDSLVAEEKIQTSQETTGSDMQQWIDKKGYELINREPNSNETPEIFPLTSDLLRDITRNIENKIKNKFNLIPAARNVKAAIGERTDFLEKETLESMRSLSITRDRQEELKWEKFRNNVEEFFDKQLVPNPDQILIRDGNLRLPPNLLGGGYQEILGLMWNLSEENILFGIEEPENHLHPGISRRFLDFLKDLADENQILISTHSPTFVDKINIQNNYIVRKEDKETSIKRVENEEEFKFILWELGVVPSDIYLKDFVVFVEGGTEKAILPIFAQKLELGNIEDKVAIIPVGGDRQIKNYLKIWLEIAKTSPLDYLVILDSHAKKLAYDLIEKLNIDRDKFILFGKRCIEDYYPKEILIDVINELFGLEITEKDIDRRRQTDKEVERILQENEKIKKDWKVQLGENIAEKMSEEQIPKDLKNSIETIRKAVNI